MLPTRFKYFARLQNANYENFAALKKQRTIIKASCTRIKTYAESVTAVKPTVVAQIEERKLKLEYYWSDYNTA